MVKAQIHCYFDIRLTLIFVYGRQQVFTGYTCVVSDDVPQI